MSKSSKVAVVILNWNGWADTIECVKSVLLSSYTDFVVVVCDNGSKDDSVERIKEWASGQTVESGGDSLKRDKSELSNPVPYLEYSRHDMTEGRVMNTNSDFPLVIIKNEENLGFAGGCNVGLRYVLKYTECSYVWLLNNDTVVTADSMSHLVVCMQSDDKVGMCGSTLFYYDEPNSVQALGGGVYNNWFGWARHLVSKAPQARSPEWIVNKMDYVVGASLMVSRRFLDEIGFMEEGYFLYFEELDWSIRAKGKFKLGYAQESVVYHKEGASAGTSSRKKEMSKLADYYINRNRLLLTSRYYPFAIPLVSISMVVTIVNRIRRGQWSRAGMVAGLLLKFLVYKHDRFCRETIGFRG